MSMSHLIILGVIALIVIPPEKLPEMARQLAKFIYDLKRTADSVMNEIKQEALFKPEDIIDQNIKTKLQELHSSLNNNVQSIQNSVQNLQNTNVNTHTATPPTVPPVSPLTAVTELPPVATPNKLTDGSDKS
ncbi:MAG: twin-arginine translocase TatA/TatE family subunit [Bdellovibrionaceae bacterium]|nr:twin-arginine translocase TatA/TatE family subunit [Pseudobdellovibrionaceae bacterium]